MKKTYIIPACENIELTEEKFLAESNVLTSDGETVTGKLNNKDAQSDGLAKGYNVWNDDWSK